MSRNMAYDLVNQVGYRGGEEYEDPDKVAITGQGSDELIRHLAIYESIQTSQSAEPVYASVDEAAKVEQQLVIQT